MIDSIRTVKTRNALNCVPRSALDAMMTASIATPSIGGIADAAPATNTGQTRSDFNMSCVRAANHANRPPGAHEPWLHHLRRAAAAYRLPVSACPLADPDDDQG